VTSVSTFPDAEAVAARAAREIAHHVERAREQRGVAHLALSGGTTPARAYELFAQTLEHWAGVEVWFADERCVGPEDEQSNYLMASRTLLGRAGIPAEHVHRMEGELGPDEGAERYAAALAQVVAPAAETAPDGRTAANGGRSSVVAAGEAPRADGLPALDLIVLGIGPDGHVASLFPRAATLGAGEEAICLGVHDSPKPPPERITLSLSVLRAARRCLLLASGAQKHAAVTAALGEPTREVPASLLRRERLSVILDDAASPTPPPGG
jgi:6-phosphogluconolactonase